MQRADVRAVERGLHALQPVAVRLGDRHPHLAIVQQRERQLGERGRGRLAEPHPDDAAALVHREVLDRHLGREGLGVGRVRGHLADEAADVDLPAVEDAAQSALLVAREHERAAAVRARFDEEADAAVAGAEGDVVLTEQTDALRRAIGLELRREDRRDPVVLAHETPHRSVSLDSRQPFVLLVRQHDRPPRLVRRGKNRVLLRNTSRLPGRASRRCAIVTA